MANKEYDNTTVIEFNIGWVKGDKKACVTAPAGTKICNNLKRLSKEKLKEVDMIINKDGSVYGHVPVSWVNISPPVKNNLSNE